MSTILRKVLTRFNLATQVLRTGGLKPETELEIPSISPEEVAEAKTIFPLEKFFIFGHARSGTTLLARLIRLHPEVHCDYQAHFFTRKPLLQSLVSDPEVKLWLVRRSNRWNRGGNLAPVILRAVSDTILEREARRFGKRVVGDKSPNSLFNDESVRLMHKVYPDARLIFIQRDGRDTAISHRFQTFVDAPHRLDRQEQLIRDAFTKDPEPFFNGERSIFTPGALRAEADSWRRNVVETDREARRLYPEAYLQVHYEALLEQPVQEMQSIWYFLGVDPKGEPLAAAVLDEMKVNPDSDWQQEKAGQLVDPLQKGRAGGWRTLFTAQDREIFKEVAGEALISCGYERDLDW